MVDVELYGYSKCSSCRNAAALLAECGVSFSSRDLFSERLSADEIRSLFSRIDVTPREMLATRSRPYREHNLGNRELSDAEVIAMMADYPALVRRPIVVAASHAHVGFNRNALCSLVATVKDGQNSHA